MPKASPIQDTFTGGEWSWQMQSRVSMDQYRTALAEMRNMFPKVNGPAMRRGASLFVHGAKSNSAAPMLMRFEFGVTQAYVLEFSNLLFRIFRDHGIIESSPGNPVEVVTTYVTADLPTIKYAQSQDTLYLTHPSYPPRKITRSSHTAWTITTITFLDGPFLPTNATSTTLTLSGTSGSVTVTASAATGINDGSGFQTTDIGRLVRWRDPANNWTWLTITARTSTTVVTATISGPNASAGTATSAWRLGAYSDTTGYPAAVTFFEDRLCFAGEPAQTVHMSKTGDYENFAPTAAAGTVADDNAVTVTLNADNVNVVRWMTNDEKGLIVGTVGGEWLVRASSQGEALTPTNVSAKQSTSNGSANVQPLRVNNATLFVQRAGFNLHEHAYNFEADGLRSPNMTVFAEEITRGGSTGLTRLAYTQEPDRIIWGLRSDGLLTGLTYQRAENVVAWHLHTLGGYSDSGHTLPPVIESIAAIPSPDGSRDELWLAVKRYIDGGTVRYIEYLAPPLGEDDDQEDAKYLDCGATYDSSAATTITGLTHLIGETVGILADGAAHPDVVVDSSGEVDLVRSASVVQIGYRSNWSLETLNIEAGAADGTAQGKTKRINKVAVRFNRTLDVQYSVPDADSFDVTETTYRQPATDMDTAQPLFTGEAVLPWPGGYDREGRVRLSGSGVFPVTITMIAPQVTTQDR